MEPQRIPEGLRIAVYNAMGGYGPYSVRQISELFRIYGFDESHPVGDIGGQRRSEAAAYMGTVDWGDLDQRRRFLMLVEDVLEEYPTVDGIVPPDARAIHRALELALRVPVLGESQAGEHDRTWAIGRLNSPMGFTRRAD